MDQLPLEFGCSVSKAALDNSVYTKYLVSNNSFKKKQNNQGDSDFNDSDDESNESDEIDDELSNVPISHSFTLESSNKFISNVKFTPSGNKVYTATSDSLLNSYDFQSMNSQSNSPSSLDPYETHQITKLDISSDSDILLLPNDSAFKVLSSELKELNSFRSGDKYIYDVKQTKGHTDIITDGCWIDDVRILTSSNDSSFRIWNAKTGKQTGVNFIKNSKGKKVKVTKVLSTASHIIAVDDGNRITTWNLTNFNRPNNIIQLDGEVTSIVSNDQDPNLILVRTKANDIKLYDLRNLKSPMIQRLNFPTELQTSQVIFYGNYILAGETYIDVSKPAKLHIMDKSDLMDITTIDSEGSISTIDWCKRSNQIAIGHSNGTVKIFFNPELSKGGILTTINNKPKKRHFDENDNLLTMNSKQVGYNMEELSQLNRTKKKKSAEEDEPKKMLIWGTTDSSKIQDIERDMEDPREALLRYSK